MSVHTERLSEQKKANIKKVCELIVNNKEGICAKEIAALTGMDSNRVRIYLNELLEKKLVYVAAKDGKTRIYKWNANHEEKPADMIDDKVRTVPDGKDFEPGTFIPCGDVCKPGDIVWVSSRSGEGQFFRYLVITPWERKATVLGIFPEGHPNLNLNDPNCVYLGNDPETGEGLYADVTNNCSRGYKQFGERLMHVDKDCMDAVKNRLARVMQIDICKKSESEADDVKRLKYKIANLEIVIEEDNKRIEEISKERDEVKFRNANQVTLIKAKIAEITELTQIRNDLQGRLKVQTDTIDQLTSENADLRQQLLEDVTSVEPQTSKEDLDLQVALLNANADLQKELKRRYEDEIDTLRGIIFSMIDKGGNN